jgi:isopentenyl diphosphate isomerase/L-lactate dehydrogenase-like FMN-dependent dehydrogenase
MTQTATVQSPLRAIPPEITCAQDYEQLAPRFMALPSFEYVAGGSGAGVTAAANRAAFARWSILPRILADVKQGHTRLTLAGESLLHPLLLAPVAFQKLAHPGGEIEAARAAQALDATIISSTLSTFSVEEIAGAAGGRHWFQLYFQSTREATLALLRRAEAAGCGAIVVTLDATIQQAGARALRAGFRMPVDCVSANLAAAPTAPVTLQEGDSAVFQGAMRDAPGWDDLAWLLANTALPVWVKGVLHPDDTRRLQAMAVAGIVISNHGGRGLDGAPASLDLLPAMRAAVGADFPLLFDGGIRSGADVFKALALGADAVLVGRLQMYALAVAGALGVAHMLKCLREELEVCMALAGCAHLADIDRSTLWPAPATSLETACC